MKLARESTNSAGISGVPGLTGATVAAGLLRRDHLLLDAPGAPGASWHSHAHDAISGLLYVSLVAAQLALAGRFGRGPAWAPWRPWLLVSAAATGVLLIAFATDVTPLDRAMDLGQISARGVSVRAATRV